MSDRVAMPSVRSDGSPDQKPGFVVIGDGQAVRAAIDDAPASDVLDPGAHTVAEVLDALAHVDEATRALILQREREGKARATILNHYPE